jgi:hypothetical protein
MSEGEPMAVGYHLQNIRVLLTEGFTDDELRRLCYDVPEFRPVYDELAQESGKGRIIDRLIEHAERKILFDALLALAQERNPARYDQHRPYRREPQAAAQLRPEAEAEAESVDRAVTVYLHCWGNPPHNMPAGALQRDWRSYFNVRATPRHVPRPATWRKVLLPELSALEQEIGPPNLVRLGGSASLAAGFAFGQTFKEVARYGLEVEQFVEGSPQRWRSRKKGAPLAWISRIVSGQPTAGDGAVIIFANPRQVLAQIIGDVGVYWGEGDVWEQAVAGEGASRKLKGILILEAEAASREKRYLTNGEAVALAHASSGALRQFIRQVQPQTLHLFLAVPLALAVFLGHQWNAVGKKAIYYEWVGSDKVYAPACELRL